MTINLIACGGTINQYNRPSSTIFAYKTVKTGWNVRYKLKDVFTSMKNHFFQTSAKALRPIVAFHLRSHSKYKISTV